MRLLVTGDAALFCNATSTVDLGDGGVWVEWEVSGSAPLGSRRHVAELLRLLSRDTVDDVAVFAAAADRHSALDPSLSAYELNLPGDGARLFLSVAPSCGFYVPLGGASVQFGRASPENVSIVGSNRRRVAKVGDDGWASSVAVSSTNVSNEGVNRWTFRIATMGDASDADALYNFRVARAASKRPTGQADADEHEDDDDGADDNSGDEADDRRETSPGAAASAAAASAPIGRLLPVVAVGVADVDVPLEAPRVHGAYPRAFMLDVSTGAFYSGTDKRPVFADVHAFQPGAQELLVTLALDTQRAVLNVVVSGEVVLVAPVPRVLAGALYPVVELYSHGAVVDII